jgi:2,3-bisphosphoglycerate-independent phosphoglycerate mutase
VNGGEGVLLLFLDGVGIGPPDAALNPFLAARLPTLTGLLGGRLPTLERLRPRGESGGRQAACVPLDARLGVEGMPQSGTGQSTLLTGRNAAELFGRHFGPWVPVRLRPLVERESILRRAVDAGLDTAFANAYPAAWSGSGGGRWVAAPPLAARAAGLLNRDHEHLGRGEAVASEILNTSWKRHLGYDELPDVSAEEAGRTLGRVAGLHALTFFAHYRTDTVGHDGDMHACVRALERVDEFLAGVLTTLPERHHLFVCSDHGNLEDLSERGHTLNPAFGMLVGPDAHTRAESLASLLDVTPSIAGWTGIGG